jgi:signal peptidase II
MTAVVKFFQTRLSLFAIAADVVLVDQLTKTWVRTALLPQEVWSPTEAMMDYFRIVHLTNTGTVGGMFESLSGFLTVLAVVLSALILIFYPLAASFGRPTQIGLSLILGGGLGNLIDRLARGSVTDFVSIGNLFIFNIADVCIVLGMAAVLYAVWSHQDAIRKE